MFAERAEVRRLAVVASVFAGWTALASVLTRRAWPSVLAAPFIGLVAVAAGIGVADAIETAGPADPWRVIRRLLSDSRPLLLVGGVALLQAAAQRLSLRTLWPAALGIWTGAAILVGAWCWPLSETHERPGIPAFLAASTLFQVFAVLGARAVARRLRPAEGP